MYLDTDQLIIIVCGRRVIKGNKTPRGFQLSIWMGWLQHPRAESPQKVTGEGGEQQGLQRLAMGMHRVGKGTQGDLGRATTMSAVVSLLPSLCLLSLSL